MSRSTASRANFKKYAEITNPLGQAKDDPVASSRTSRRGGWLDADSTRGDRDGDSAILEADEDEEDPFGLAPIMCKAGQDEEIPARSAVEAGELEYEDEEEEEDPFGLGAIMSTNHSTTIDNIDDERVSGTKRPSSSLDGSTTVADSATRKAQKNAVHAANSATKTTGGYFKGTTSSRAREDGDISSSARTTAAAKNAQRRPYLPANRFEGRREGYAFQNGELGLGYYADEVQARARLARLKAAAVAAATAERRGGVANRAGTPDSGVGESSRRVGATKDGIASSKAPVDVPVVVQKLKALLLKPKKAAKAASLMADLIQAEMRPENGRLFLRALKPLAEDPAGECASAAGEGGARAFRTLLERGEAWIGGPAEGVRAVTWELLFGLRHDVKTDDSFQFARAVKRLREAIEALGETTGAGEIATGDTAAEAEVAKEGGMSLALERKRAVILIMKEAFKSYHLAWARSSIEPAFKAAADRRRLFPDGDLRDALDGFTDTITKRQRNPGGAMAPPTRSVRAHNSMAHPMLNKRSDIIR